MRTRYACRLILLLSWGLPFAVTGAQSTRPPISSLPVINVRDFGASGDGVRDDAPAIQRAMNALAAAGRGKLVFEPFGVYRIGKVLVLSGAGDVKIDGQGATLKPMDRLTITSRTGEGDTLIVQHCSRLGLRDLNFDGNRSARGARETAVTLRLCDCSDFRIARCTFTGAICDDLYVSAFDSLSDATSCRDGVVEDCRFDGAWRNAISIIHAHNLVIRNNTIRNVAGTRPEAGIDIEANAGGSNPDSDGANRDIVVSGNFISGCAGAAVQVPGVKNPTRITIAGNNMSGSGVSVPDDQGASEIAVCDNVIHDVAGVGIAIGGVRGVVRGNRLVNGTGFGIYATGGQHLISGNSLTDFGVEGNGRCITVGNHSSGGCIVEGNVVRKTVANRAWIPIVRNGGDFSLNNFQFGCQGRDGEMK